MKKVFSGETVEQCLEDASKDLKLEKEKIKYTVIEEKKGIFKKSASISVEFEETVPEDVIDINDGTVMVSDGNIIIRNPSGNGKPAEIASKNVRVMVDEEELKTKIKVYEHSEVEVFLPESKPSRSLDLRLSEDKMQAYISIKYTPQIVYKLIDRPQGRFALLESDIKETIMPPKYTVVEIKQKLTNYNIVCGIIEANLNQCAEGEVENLLIAKGEEVIDAADDVLDLKFEVENDSKQYAEDNTGRVDFKSIGSVNAVSQGDILAVKIPGHSGKDGCDVTGAVKKYKPGKKIKIKAADGCILKDENTITAVLAGKPCIKNNAFYVYQVHEVKSDVDLKTGNIRFIGDVIIYGAVKEGMKVDAGNSIDIYKSVERADIAARGNISIKGNVIASHINGGGQDIVKLKQIENLSSMHIALNDMMKTIEEIKKFNLLGEGRSDGEIIKVLIETKFKSIPRLYLGLVTAMTVDKHKNHEDTDNLPNLIKQKLIGLAPLSIKNYGELDAIITAVNDKINFLKGSLSLAVTVSILYCQESDVCSSGDVIINGKGIYVSNVTATNSIRFMNGNGVVRGGMLKAEHEIKCNTVGSPGGVATKLAVGKDGHIFADCAYENTIFIVGSREYYLEAPCKNIHGYIDSNGELMVEKLKL